ncbi:protein DpdH [Nocardia farcinica]|uniref:protein DpdH n=1 Tax=Nocardia farcinica TaxID=37329 RepID=UPI002453CDCA|nr:protein DpdH [Nocardia farcinica]
MITFPTNFTCWKAETVVATISTEAATPSDEVLLATHSPLSIRREGSRAGASAGRVSEGDVLDEFLGTAPNAGVVIAPVLGESGAGKSHLVRWVYATMPKSDEKRHIIYLPKTQTSLRDVVEELLKGRAGPVFDEIRGQVTSGTSVTVEEMERRILNELAEAVRSRAPQGPLDKKLVGDDGLALLFHDPLFREHMLRTGSFINRRAVHALNGRGSDEADIPLEFTEDELPMDIADSARLIDAAAVTQRLFRRLSTDSRMQAEAVRILNEVLDVAITKAANIGVGNINRAFMKLREELVGHEIILLIEDVALIQGVRRDLLDAIIETSIVQGKEKYATVRALLAVTPSYYRENLPETFRTRAEASSPKYVVDVELSPDGAEDSQLVDFVSRYLNAARVGKDRLESSMRATAMQAVPNACDDCAFREACHDVFGTSDVGYGLYPYNRSAIERAVRACADVDRSGGDALLFNPRRVLARAVRDVLETAEGLIKIGEFPPPGLLEEESSNARLPGLATEVVAELEDYHAAPDTVRQLQTFLLFWGENGTCRPPETIFSAFGIDPLPNALTFEPEADRLRPVSDPREGVAGLPADHATSKGSGKGELSLSVQRQLDQIDAWGGGNAVLPQKIAQEARNIIREAILNRLHWFDPAIKYPDAATLNKALPTGARGISIEGVNESIASTVEPVLRVSRTGRNALMLKGLVLLEAKRPDLSGEALARLDALVSEAIPVVAQRVLETLEYDKDKLVAAARSLIEGAHVCGYLTYRQKKTDLISALIWRGNASRADQESRNPQWNIEYRKYIEERAKAVDKFVAAVGVAQGMGGVHALDNIRLIEIVKSVRVTWDTPVDPQQLPIWCTAAHRQLGNVVQLAPLQINEWTQLSSRVRRLLPAGESYADTVDAIIRAADEGSGQGLVPVQNLSALTAANTSARVLNERVVTRVEKAVADAAGKSGYELACVVGGDVGGDLNKLVDFLEASAQWIEQGIRNGEVDQGSALDIDVAIDEQVQRWLMIVGEDGANA